MDPIAQFHIDRGQAREAGDPMAHVCTVANVDQHGQAQVRTLVLRDHAGDLAIFVNATSAKWQPLVSGFALQTYWPSTNIQYRMHVESQQIDPAVVHESWHLRPDAPKRMDWYYEQFSSQGSRVENRQKLLAELDEVGLPDPLAAPVNAKGLLLTPQKIERLDLNQSNGVHDRQLFELVEDNYWRHSILVP